MSPKEARAVTPHTSVALGLALLVALSPAAMAFSLPLPGAVQSGQHSESLGSYRIPSGPFAAGRLPVIEVEGEVVQTAWRLPGSTATTLELLAPIRAELAGQGFLPLFECETEGCGGFDFRYGMDILPEPDMHVGLGDFRYFAASRGSGDAAEHVVVVVSRSAAAGHVQITRISPRAQGAPAALPLPAPEPEAPVVADAPPAVPAPPGDPRSDPLTDRLVTEGHVVLDDLVFASGDAALAAGPFPSLALLAAWLKVTPDARVMLVGHTDAAGGLAGNIALSRARALAVRRELIDRLGVDPAQVQADGVGFLAPLASNLTEDGRRQNRRVEAILTSTQLMHLRQ